MGAPARVIQKGRRRRHLSLVDNIDAGEAIVAKAQQKQDALLVARELGVDLEPVEVPTRRRARKRQPNLNGPVISRQLSWDELRPEVQEIALMMCGGDKRLVKPIDPGTFVILNQPQRNPPR